MAATKKNGLRVIPLTLLMVFLLKLLPGDKQTPLTPNLAEFAPAHIDWYRETLMELLDLVVAGKIKPVVAERFPLVEAARAHEWLERGGYAGKVVRGTDVLPKINWELLWRYVVWWEKDLRLSIGLHLAANVVARLAFLMAALAM